MGDRPPKSIKPEASFILEKKKSYCRAHKAYPAVRTARDRASETLAMRVGFGPPIIVKSSTRCGSKSFYNLEVRLKVTLHFKFYNFWL